MYLSLFKCIDSSLSSRNEGYKKARQRRFRSRLCSRASVKLINTFYFLTYFPRIGGSRKGNVRGKNCKEISKQNNYKYQGRKNFSSEKCANTFTPPSQNSKIKCSVPKQIDRARINTFTGVVISYNFASYLYYHFVILPFRVLNTPFIFRTISCGHYQTHQPPEGVYSLINLIMLIVYYEGMDRGVLKREMGAY